MLLEQLVIQHIAKHQNDPRKSLESVSSIVLPKDDLQDFNDPDIYRAISLVRSNSAGISTVEFSVGTGVKSENLAESSSTAAARYEIIRLHAKGGRGQVSLAKDTELNREVALKEIQPLHAIDPESRTRFVREAEITGRLEHPGIVPVYGLGHGSNGSPFYAMRFVRETVWRRPSTRFTRRIGKRNLRGTRIKPCDNFSAASSMCVMRLAMHTAAVCFIEI
jgi:hypothetical protein